jgi:uncharacterized protein YgbK (DUF1537 family)
LRVAGDVVVVDTETRHQTPSSAFEQVVQIVRASGTTPDFIYKKTDSTLRGNIRSELSALAAVFPDWRIGYAPAYPDQGRTVTDGIVYVHGVPVVGTSFARDGLNPVSTSSVRDLIGTELRCAIFDGTNNSDVEDAADAILADRTMRIAAGPTALAGALAARLQPRRLAKGALPSVRTCVVLNGSRTDVSSAQVSYAETHGCMGRDAHSAWAVADPKIAAESEAATVAALRAEHLMDLLQRRPTDGVLIIGGDTAFAFVSALDSPPIIPIAEVVPGVAISRIDNSGLRRRLPAYDRDLVLITKAGGFGEVDVLCRVRQILEQNAG